MSPYLLTPRAKQDFQEISRWYTKHRGAETARKAVRDIRSQLQQLACNPEIGHIEEDLASRDHLFWPHRQFLIIYLRDTKPLQIVTIWDARRGVPELD
jgi:plasmid stabilization system protein ParE